MPHKPDRPATQPRFHPWKKHEYYTHANVYHLHGTGTLTTDSQRSPTPQSSIETNNGHQARMHPFLTYQKIKYLFKIEKRSTLHSSTTRLCLHCHTEDDQNLRRNGQNGVPWEQNVKLVDWIHLKFTLFSKLYFSPLYRSITGTSISFAFPLETIDSRGNNYHQYLCCPFTALH